MLSIFLCIIHVLLSKLSNMGFYVCLRVYAPVHIGLWDKSRHMPQGMCKTYRTATGVGPSLLFSWNKGLSSAVHCCTWQLSWLVNFWGSPFFFPNPHKNTGITGVQYCLNELCGVKLRTSCVPEKRHGAISSSWNEFYVKVNIKKVKEEI